LEDDEKFNSGVALNILLDMIGQADLCAVFISEEDVDPQSVDPRSIHLYQGSLLLDVMKSGSSSNEFDENVQTQDEHVVNQEVCDDQDVSSVQTELSETQGVSLDLDVGDDQEVCSVQRELSETRGLSPEGVDHLEVSTTEQVYEVNELFEHPELSDGQGEVSAQPIVSNDFERSRDEGVAEDQEVLNDREKAVYLPSDVEEVVVDTEVLIDQGVTEVQEVAAEQQEGPADQEVTESLPLSAEMDEV